MSRSECKFEVSTTQEEQNVLCQNALSREGKYAEYDEVTPEGSESSTRPSYLTAAPTFSVYSAFSSHRDSDRMAQRLNLTR